MVSAKNTRNGCLKMNVTNIEESADDACRTLAHFLLKNENFSNEKIRNLILRDLCWRIPDTDPLERAIILAGLFSRLLPLNIKSIFHQDCFGNNEQFIIREYKRKRVDIGIITVIKNELHAVLTALGRNPEDKPDHRKGAFSYWHAIIERESAPPLSIVVTFVGEARNVPCAICSESLLENYSVEALILIGIAAGPKSKVKLGDVVIADQIYDYEEQRLEVKKILFFKTNITLARQRPKFIATKKVIKSDLKRINDKKFLKQFNETLKIINPDLLPKNYNRSQNPKIHDGTIAAGEKLFADGVSIENLRSTDERVRGASMEDSGFAQTAENKGLPWCVFRGISDYGDPYKSGDWQYIATISAVSAAITFLKTYWEPSSL